jgi:hypothetical protein
MYYQQAVKILRSKRKYIQSLYGFGMSDNRCHKVEKLATSRARKIRQKKIKKMLLRILNLPDPDLKPCVNKTRNPS